LWQGPCARVWSYFNKVRTGPEVRDVEVAVLIRGPIAMLLPHLASIHNLQKAQANRQAIERLALRVLNVTANYSFGYESHNNAGGGWGQWDNAWCVHIADLIFLKESRLVSLNCDSAWNETIESKIPILVSHPGALINLDQRKRNAAACSWAYNRSRKNIRGRKLLLWGTAELSAQDCCTDKSKQSHKQGAVRGRKHRGTRVPHVHKLAEKLASRQIMKACRNGTICLGANER
jgi:hypothetical protein